LGIDQAGGFRWWPSYTSDHHKLGLEMAVQSAAGGYCEEIKRLIDIRHDLMHGKIIPIVNHRSTDDAQKEVYLLSQESSRRFQNERKK
jgi:hypothetical protein